MIRLINYRAIIEKFDTHEKFYPKVISADTEDSSPLSGPASSSIKIIANNSSYNPESITDVEFDDVIRLQASIRYSRKEKHVWQDLFEGRIQNQSRGFGTDNTIDLACEGHLLEAYYGAIVQDYTWTNVDAQTILNTVCTGHMGRVQYNAAYVASGLTIPEYNIDQQQYVSDVLEDLEKIGGYKWFFDVKPVYTAVGNFEKAYLTWKQYPTVPVKTYKIIEGTPRLISASFDVVCDEFASYLFVNGGDNGAGGQFMGTADDDDAVLKYGNRYRSESYTWIKSNSLCSTIAAGLVEDSKEVAVAGQVTLELTPEARKGDLVTVKIPSLEVKGASISGNYVVKRVQHALNDSNPSTMLDLGRIRKDAYDYISKNITQAVKTCKKNFKK